LTEAQELQQRTSRPRLFQLDALRGLAAVTVILHHFHAAYPALRDRWFFVLFGSGSSAVVLFFLLSGYVLSLPSWSGTRGRYSVYVVRRVCRIYLPFAAAAGLSIAGDLYFRRYQLPLTAWYQQTWHSAVSLKTVAEQLTMWPMPNFNTAFWSLFFEMVMSLVMPLLCVALKRWNAVLLTAASYFAIYGATWVLVGAHVEMVQHPLLENVMRTLQVMCHFLLGATLAMHAVRLGELWRRLGGWQWAVLAASVFMYLDLPLVPSGLAGPVAWHLCVAAGAAGVLVCSLHMSLLARLLEHELPEYLGRISYSVYLMHGIVLFAVLDMLYGKLPTVVLLEIVVVGSLVLGHLFCIAVEEPSMRLGKKIAGRMREGHRTSSYVSGDARVGQELLGGHR
jgi:peptidoglycan/LPS O-acetylase OafA/YrhL